MPRWTQPLTPAGGVFTFWPNTRKVIRFARFGCVNRPFFHIVVAEDFKHQHGPVIEMVGSYDPMLNERNEKYVAINFDRIRYWLGRGADISRPAAELLGYAGFLPIHPRQYMMAWRNRAKQEAELKEAEAAAAAATAAIAESQSEASSSDSNKADPKT